MKRIIALAITAVLVVSSLAACGNDKEENPKTDTTVNQPQSNDSGNNNSSADPNLPRVWRTAQRGQYENGVWANAGLRYERNAYGLYTAINVYDDNGNKTDNNARVTESYDGSNRLTKFDNGNKTYFFTYDQTGKMSQIHVQDKKGRDLVKLTYTDEGGYCAVTYDENYTNTYVTNIYDENLNRLSYESTNLGEVKLHRAYTYNDAGLLAKETYSKSPFDYLVEYFYDSEGRLTKQVNTETLIGMDVSDQYIDEYTYSAAGNLLKHTGTKYGDPGFPDGLLYAFEEYTDADYDENGECLYYYDVNKNTWTGEYTFEKEPCSVTFEYEYAEDGWLLQKNDSDGGFTRYDKNGNVVVEKTSGSLYTYGYQEYAIIDDDLLVTFYELYGDEFV